MHLQFEPDAIPLKDIPATVEFRNVTFGYAPGIPILSDLPLIGRLFSQTETREEKQDLLILLTPRIVDEGATGR